MPPMFDALFCNDLEKQLIEIVCTEKIALIVIESCGSGCLLYDIGKIFSGLRLSKYNYSCYPG